MTKARSMTRLFSTFILGMMVMMVGLLPSLSFASDLAGRTEDVGNQVVQVPRFLAVIAYVIGTFFAARGLLALKNHIVDSSKNPITEFIAYAGISAMLIALPYAIKVAAGTLGANRYETSAQSTSKSFEQTHGCEGSSDLGLVFCHMTKETRPIAALLGVIAYVMAVVIAMRGFLQLKAYGDDPSQVPLRSIIIKFVLATMLISLPLAMQVFITSVTGAKGVEAQATIKKPRLYK